MLQNTRGVVLSHIKYRETSLIVKIYTEAFGLQTYIVNGVRSSKASKSKSAFFQPLMLLDLIVYHKDGQSMHHIKEIKTAYIFKNIPYEHKKCVIAIFLSEILQNTIYYSIFLIFQEIIEFTADYFVINQYKKTPSTLKHLYF